MSYERRNRAVPTNRINRLGQFGGFAAGLAGNVAAEGLGQVLRGNRPRLADLLLTPSNALA